MQINLLTEEEMAVLERVERVSSIFETGRGLETEHGCILSKFEADGLMYRSISGWIKITEKGRKILKAHRILVKYGRIVYTKDQLKLPEISEEEVFGPPMC